MFNMGYKRFFRVYWAEFFWGKLFIVTINFFLALSKYNAFCPTLSNNQKSIVIIGISSFYNILKDLNNGIIKNQ